MDRGQGLTPAGLPPCSQSCTRGKREPPVAAYQSKGMAPLIRFEVQLLRNFPSLFLETPLTNAVTRALITATSEGMGCQPGFIREGARCTRRSPARAARSDLGTPPIGFL